MSGVHVWQFLAIHSVAKQLEHRILELQRMQVISNTYGLWPMVYGLQPWPMTLAMAYSLWPWPLVVSMVYGLWP